MSRQHYGVLAGVISGYVLARLLSFWAIDAVGAIAGHRRPEDMAIGVIVTGFPFAVLAVFTILQLGSSPALDHRAVKALFVAGWFMAGAIMGLLPYSRLGTATHLHWREARVAPGFLHGMDFTVVVGVAVAVALLFAALQARHPRPPEAHHSAERQFEDER